MKINKSLETVGKELNKEKEKKENDSDMKSRKTVKE